MNRTLVASILCTRDIEARRTSSAVVTKAVCESLFYVDDIRERQLPLCDWLTVNYQSSAIVTPIVYCFVSCKTVCSPAGVVLQRRSQALTVRPTVGLSEVGPVVAWQYREDPLASE